MKNVLIVMLCLVAISFLSYTQQDDKKGLARVNKINGKEVYILCQPLRDYDVVEDVSKFGTSNAFTTIQTTIETYLIKADKKGVEYDALLIDGGSRGQLIKFK